MFDDRIKGVGSFNIFVYLYIVCIVFVFVKLGKNAYMEKDTTEKIELGMQKR